MATLTHSSIPDGIWEMAIKRDIYDHHDRNLLVVAAGYSQPLVKYYVPNILK